MEHKTSGNTGLKVSELCLGAMDFSSSFHNIGEVDLDLAKDLIKTSWDAGVNFFDTADVYSKGESEQILGQAIKDLVIERCKAVITTKVRGPMSEEASEVRAMLTIQDYRANTSLEPVDASLERLGTDYIDLYQIHGVDDQKPIEKTFSALNDFIRMGKGHYINRSNLSVRQLAKSL